MKFKAFLDKAGRVAIPKPILKEMQLAPGDQLGIERNGDSDTIALRPIRS